MTVSAIYDKMSTMTSQRATISEERDVQLEEEEQNTI